MEQLKKQILVLQKNIEDIDNKSIYSLSYYFFNEGAKREQMVEQIKTLELEIEHIKDDLKRYNYKQMRDRDPLKMSRKR